jgi:hypothetical protein
MPVIVPPHSARAPGQDIELSYSGPLRGGSLTIDRQESDSKIDRKSGIIIHHLSEDYVISSKQ